jgi:hypothetical protein
MGEVFESPLTDPALGNGAQLALLVGHAKVENGSAHVRPPLAKTGPEIYEARCEYGRDD